MSLGGLRSRTAPRRPRDFPGAIIGDSSFKFANLYSNSRGARGPKSPVTKQRHQTGGGGVQVTCIMILGIANHTQIGFVVGNADLTQCQ